MLSVADEVLSGMNPKARLVMYGQELNAESYAICKADMLIKGQDIGHIVHGNTLSDDGLPGHRFDYMLSNPPFGVEWKKIEKAIRREAEQDGFNGRFGPGLPRVSDGSLLFLLHLLSKMRRVVDGGSRFGIVLNGSPLFTSIRCDRRSRSASSSTSSRTTRATNSRSGSRRRGRRWTSAKWSEARP
jgi:type I restriction enzyme M protein